jgi:hypothetical protein
MTGSSIDSSVDRIPRQSKSVEQGIGQGVDLIRRPFWNETLVRRGDGSDIAAPEQFLMDVQFFVGEFECCTDAFRNVTEQVQTL